MIALAPSLKWRPDDGPELELPMRLYVEAGAKISLRQHHPELVFDPERLSFR